MTPEEEYCFDVRGYLVVERAVEPDYLAHLNERLGFWEEKARKELADGPEKKRRGVQISGFSTFSMKNRACWPWSPIRRSCLMSTP